MPHRGAALIAVRFRPPANRELSMKNAIAEAIIDPVTRHPACTMCIQAALPRAPGAVQQASTARCNARLLTNPVPPRRSAHSQATA